MIYILYHCSELYCPIQYSLSNLTLYKQYNDIEINQAIDRAGLRNFVDVLENGLDTYIYDNGKNISGGEKSRIAIARALLVNADIILLDEAFAGLDSKVSKEIESTLLNLEGITVINVSHVVFQKTKDKYNKVLVVKDKTVVIKDQLINVKRFY